MELFEAIKSLIVLIILFSFMSILPSFVIYWLITDEGKKNKFLGLMSAFFGSIFIFWMWGSQFPGWERSIGKISYLFS